MYKTKHIKARMSQRGISEELLKLTIQFGEIQGDKTILGRKALQELLTQLRKLQRTTMKALDKGGVTLIEENGCLLTAYNINQ